MKKIFTLILIFSLTIQIFALNFTSKYKIQKYAEREKEFIQNQKLEKILKDPEKTKKALLQYEKEQLIDLWIPVMLNLFLPFGVGSFVQGDYIGGGCTLGFNLLGLTLLTTGVIQMKNLKKEPASISSMILLLSGMLTFGSSYLISIYLPVLFEDRYYKNLINQIIDELAGFEPNLDIGMNGFQLSFKKSY